MVEFTEKTTYDYLASWVPGKIMQDIVYVRIESYIGKDKFGVTTGKREKKALITSHRDILIPPCTCTANFDWYCNMNMSIFECIIIILNLRDLWGS